MALTPFFFGRDLQIDPLSEKFFEPFSGLLENGPSRQLAKEASSVANTRIDWVETADAHIIKADLPGLSKDEVKIEIEDGRTLSISGERKKEEVRKNDKWHCFERVRGSFLRKFRLPEDCKVDEVKAKVENGVLSVTIPKAKQPKPQTHTINVA